MTTDEHKCQNILDTERKTGKKVTVTFNYRYSPFMTKIKELLVARQPYYSQAHHTIDTDDISPQGIVDKIVSIVSGEKV